MPANSRAREEAWHRRAGVGVIKRKGVIHARWHWELSKQGGGGFLRPGGDFVFILRSEGNH